VAQGPEIARQLTQIIEASLDDDQAADLIGIDLTGKTTIADRMIVASGRNARHVAAMADHLIEKVKGAGLGPVLLEGQETAEWIVVDAGDVVVHLFQPAVRSFYNIEKMWLNAPGLSGEDADGEDADGDDA
jgi:ribosome-associated protein